MHRPHLLEGYKYDLRLYVLLSSVQPLRIFLFREGLVRVCTEKYAPLERNIDNVRMHLTNYAINKNAEVCHPVLHESVVPCRLSLSNTHPCSLLAATCPLATVSAHRVGYAIFPLAPG